jgi:hypothetical protein
LTFETIYLLAHAIDKDGLYNRLTHLLDSTV